MLNFSIWAYEFVRFLTGRRLHPVVTQCPICRQMVHLHVDKSGRRHMYGHARALYEGSRFSEHYAASIRCDGSGAVKVFDPRPNERQHFKLPDTLQEK